MSLAFRDWPLWSTGCRLVTERSVLDRAAAIVDDLLAQVDAACSRFRPDSELLTLTRDEQGWSDISPMLADLLREALDAAIVSRGAVDPVVGSAMTALGYDRDLAAVRARTATGTTLSVVRRPTTRPRLLGTRVLIPEGVQLDLGATAKGVAADRCAAAVAARLHVPVLVSLGGDIATAGPAPVGGWQVTVQDLPVDEPVQVCLAAGAALATSSTRKRTWEYGGRTLHHIVDPATGLPSSGPWRTASVVAETCALANTASTGALVMGTDAVGWLRQLRLPARLVDEESGVVTLNGWPAEGAS